MQNYNAFKKQARQTMEDILVEMRKWFNYSFDDYTLLSDDIEDTLDGALRFKFEVTFFKPKEGFQQDAILHRDVFLEIKPDMSVYCLARTFKCPADLQQLFQHIKQRHLKK